jgi:hypothetical protein
LEKLKFRVVISARNAIIYFDLTDLIHPALFSRRELLIPWLLSGNKPDLHTGYKEIYTGDIMTSPLMRAEFLPCVVKFGQYTDIAEAGCTSHSNIGFYIEDPAGRQTGLLNEELLVDWDSFKVIGNIHQCKCERQREERR